MSTKAYTLIIIGAGLLLLIGGFLLGWNVKPIKTCSEIVDSVYIEGDAVWITSDTTYIIKWKNLLAVTDTTGIIKSSSIDTIFTHNEDAIKIEAKISYNTKTDVFDWLMKIDHKDFSSHTTDTLKVYMTEIEVREIDNPLWITISIAEFILLLLAIVF